MNCTIEFVAFSDLDREHFQLFDGESRNEDIPLDVDLRILIDAKLPAECAAQILEAAAEKLRRSMPSDLANIRRALRQIGGCS